MDRSQPEFLAILGTEFLYSVMALMFLILYILVISKSNLYLLNWQISPPNGGTATDETKPS